MTIDSFFENTFYPWYDAEVHGRGWMTTLVDLLCERAADDGDEITPVHLDGLVPTEVDVAKPILRELNGLFNTMKQSSADYLCEKADSAPEGKCFNASSGRYTIYSASKHVRLREGLVCIKRDEELFKQRLTDEGAPPANTPSSDTESVQRAPDALLPPPLTGVRRSGSTGVILAKAKEVAEGLYYNATTKRKTKFSEKRHVKCKLGDVEFLVNKKDTDRVNRYSNESQPDPQPQPDPEPDPEPESQPDPQPQPDPEPPQPECVDVCPPPSVRTIKRITDRIAKASAKGKMFNASTSRVGVFSKKKHTICTLDGKQFIVNKTDREMLDKFEGGVQCSEPQNDPSPGGAANFSPRVDADDNTASPSLPFVDTARAQAALSIGRVYNASTKRVTTFNPKKHIEIVFGGVKFVANKNDESMARYGEAAQMPDSPVSDASERTPALKEGDVAVEEKDEPQKKKRPQKKKKKPREVAVEEKDEPQKKKKKPREVAVEEKDEPQKKKKKKPQKKKKAAVDTPPADEGDAGDVVTEAQEQTEEVMEMPEITRGMYSTYCRIRSSRGGEELVKKFEKLRYAKIPYDAAKYMYYHFDKVKEKFSAGRDMEVAPRI